MIKIKQPKSRGAEKLWTNRIFQPLCVEKKYSFILAQQRTFLEDQT
jgi:hypothetical protein